MGGIMFRETCDYLSVDEEKVTRIRKDLGLRNVTTGMAEVFKLLSDPTRLSIIQALELEELCVCDIAALLGLTQPSVSHHLKALRHSGIVKYRKSGKMALYSLRGSRISALLAVARDQTRLTN
jgi:DNA-binding transcriptional ArsR family regulator